MTTKLFRIIWKGNKDDLTERNITLIMPSFDFDKEFRVKEVNETKIKRGRDEV